MDKKISKYLLIIAVIVAGLLIAGSLIFIGQKRASSVSPEIISAELAGEKTINFINKTMLPEGMEASLIDISEESGIYKIHLKIDGEEYTSYVTRDGKILFPQEGIKIEEEVPAPEEQAQVMETPQGNYSDEKLEALAKCLADKGAKFYGTPTCPWCSKQRELFGQAAKYLPYVDCMEKMEECEAAEVGGVPDWRFQDGTQKLGMQPIEELARLSGCEL